MPTYSSKIYIHYLSDRKLTPLQSYILQEYFGDQKAHRVGTIPPSEENTFMCFKEGTIVVMQRASLRTWERIKREKKTFYTFYAIDPSNEVSAPALYIHEDGIERCVLTLTSIKYGKSDNDL